MMNIPSIVASAEHNHSRYNNFQDDFVSWTGPYDRWAWQSIGTAQALPTYTSLADTFKLSTYLNTFPFKLRSDFGLTNFLVKNLDSN